MILGEIKDEFRDFKASVTGELSGFRLAIESMNAQMGGIESRMSAIESQQDNIENDLRDIRRTIDETRAELKAEIMQNTRRIDDLNKRVDALYVEVSEMRGELKQAISNKEIIQDIIFRIERLETKVVT